ncbi:MAG: ATP-binding protein [Methylotenera sp.]|nr:ATP-binding protein [Methylotenera sp.]MDO9234379.1 ATP-binding protein [Methylotenera sp.]MDO9389743.1 ATP-binding protein [Methylotenera sp.]MDP2101270.1 ATP-binding protein [Methylotenera sp.]MDP2280708.1 ATP-binding protein [Methylotenera sp.]
MRLLPNTLLARVMLLIATLLAIGQVASLQIFEYFERGPRAEATALQAVTVVNYTRASLIASQESLRLALLSELTGKEGVRVYSADFMEEIEPLPADPFINMVADKIRERLGVETIITVNHYGIEGLWVSFGIGMDDFWVVIPRIHVDRPFPWKWLGWVALVLLLSLAGGYVIAARINRPLHLLMNAANRLRKGEHPEKLPEGSFAELREVNDTFNKMADSLAELDAERTLILAGVSHDIRTPLARLRLSVEMLPDENCASLKIGMIQDIADMDNIIHQFLDFVKGVEGEPTQMTDINMLLQALHDRQARAGRDLVIQLAPTYVVPIKPLAMQRLLDNLVGNAYAYGHGQVRVASQITADYIVISVFDNGPGIPESHVEKLLKPFERLDTARSNAGGSGLGLAIADRIAKLHHGKLELINRPEGGLEARLSIPIKN